MKQELESLIQATVKDLFGLEVKIALTRPEEQLGDYAANVALQLAKQLNKNPQEIAETLATKLREDLAGQANEVSVAGPGFINLKLTDKKLLAALKVEPDQTLDGQEILVEFGDPNPFKEMHIGHLYSYIVGDAISNILEASGAKVERLSYHGDVGLHVAKAIYGIQIYKTQRESEDRSLDSIPDEELANFIALSYALGAQKYDEDEEAKNQIHEINEHIYKRDDEAINKLYDWGKEKSFNYFDNVLNYLKIKTGKRYFESESAETGKKFVKDNIGKVFEESDGAIVYRGEKVNLHTRVFITSKGLPTYETKDLGLAELKNLDYPSAKESIIITAHEQSEYFKVMLAALKEFDKPLATKTRHLSHGFLSLSTGKMSSRTGDVYSAVNLLMNVEQEIKKKYPDSSSGTDLAAIKYGFLKHRLGSDIVYDIEESVNLEGNSGPYLQYAHARARSILAKAESDSESRISDLEPNERSLARKISEYPEVVNKAVIELMPHHVCTYLYELAQTFNRFYEHNRVIGDERQEQRLNLVEHYAVALKKGLELLGIAAPERL